MLGHDGPALAIDTETTGVGFYDTPFAATATFRHPTTGKLVSGYFDLDGDESGARAALLRRVLDQAQVWIGHNLKFDLQKLILAGIIERADIDVHELHDTATLYHMLDENSPKALKALAVSVLKHDDTIEVPYKTKGREGTRKVPREEYRLGEARKRMGLKKSDGYHLLPRDVLIPYALRDTEFTLRLFEELLPRLVLKGDVGLENAYEREMGTVVALLDMEADGFALDLPYLERTTSEYGVRVMKGWQRIVDLTGRPDLNPNAPGQLLEAFAARGLRLESTEVAELGKLDDDLARAVLAYRADKKIHQTYLAALLDEQRDGRIHPSFNPTGARTGRLSSGTGAG
jgi:DNA polymerase I-like protein with 3'-5' exonuclease and polymerase domains